jgi:tetratricopeptide (TPR) repeat protein
VDALCDPELESRAARGKLHTITCPNGHTGEAPIPLLLLKEGEPPAILLVPRGASDSDGVSHFELCARLIKDPERKAQLPRFDDMCLVHAEDVVGIGSPLRQDELLGAVPRLDALVRTAKSSEQAASAPLEEGGLPPLALSVAHWEGVTRHRAFAAAPGWFRRGAHTLAAAAWYRWSQAGATGDSLDQALGHGQAALALARDDPSGLGLYYNQGVTLVARFERGGHQRDLEDAVLCFDRCLQWDPRLDYVLLPASESLLRRYSLFGRLDDLRKAGLHLLKALKMKGHELL